MKLRHLAALGAFAFALAPAVPLPARAQPVYGSAQRARVGGLISPLLALEVRRLERAAGRWERQSRTMVPLEVTSTRDVSAQIRRLGGRVEAEAAGRVVAALLPVNSIGELAHMPGVGEVYPSQRLRPQLDVSVPEIRAPLAWALKDPSGLNVTGTHVLVGIVDSGIDYRNPDFQNPDGSTRIKYIWDQTGSGNPPAGYSFGYECTSASINDRSCPEKDTDGHGTNVAGIAAGNGRSSSPAREIGVAPTADIIVVKTTFETDKIIAAWKYLIDKAKHLKEPIVINNSFGTQLSPHDGSEPDSLAADELSGPGRVFVAAAGNAAGKSLHTLGSVSQGGTSTLTVDARGGTDDLTFALFYARQDTMSFTLTDTATGETFGPVAHGAQLTGQANKAGNRSISMDATDPDASHHGVLVDIQSSDSGASLSGEWRLTIAGTSVSDAGSFNAWIDDGNGGNQGFVNSNDADTVGDPADGKTMIAVANYATRTVWTGRDGRSHTVCELYICNGGTLAVGDIKASSSHGPTEDGRQKPDIAAPGTMIISSLSRDAAICSGRSSATCIDPALVTADGKNIVDSGTSMSSPHVAGVVALMMQVDPSLDPATADSILRSTARHDSFTGSAAWTPVFGAGKVDAYASVQAAMHAMPAPTPVATTIAASPTFHILAVRAAAHASANGWKAGSPRRQEQIRLGKSVILSIYSKYTHLSSGARLELKWTVGRSGNVVMSRLQTVGRSASGVVWNHMRFTPKKTGVYTFTGTVRLNGQHAALSTGFRVVRK